MYFAVRAVGSPAAFSICMHTIQGLPATRFWDGLLPMRENKTPAVIVSLTIWTLFPKSKVCSEDADNPAERRVARMKIFEVSFHVERGFMPFVTLCWELPICVI